MFMTSSASGSEESRRKVNWLTLLLLTTAAGVLAVIVWLAAVVFWVSKRAGWVVLRGTPSEGVFLAKNAEDVRLLLAAPPTLDWDLCTTFYGAHPLPPRPPEADRALEAAVRAGQVFQLEGGSKAKVIDRTEVRVPPCPPGQRKIEAVEVLRIEIREGPRTGTRGWTLIGLMQYEAGWL